VSTSTWQLYFSRLDICSLTYGRSVLYNMQDTWHPWSMEDGLLRYRKCHGRAGPCKGLFFPCRPLQVGSRGSLLLKQLVWSFLNGRSVIESSFRIVLCRCVFLLMVTVTKNISRLPYHQN
jgi:hypothetical protein